MLAVATYNVHSCIGRDRRMDPARVAAVIRALDADLVALQEVDAREHPHGYVDQWAELAAATGTHAIPGISLRTHRKLFGNALLSRRPVLAVRLHDLTVAGREPRGAIEADIAVDGRILQVIATHLGLKTHERRHQAERLGALVAARAAAGAPGCHGTLLLGDLNEWRPGPGTLRALLRHLPAQAVLPSFPARWPVMALDRVMAGPGLTLTETRVDRSALARAASDHLPVRAMLHWTDGHAP